MWKSEEFQKRLENEITLFEQKTSVEIVAAALPRACDYRSDRHLLFWLCAFGVFLLQQVFPIFWQSLLGDLFVALSAGLGVWALSRWEPLLRLILPESRKLEEVSQAARVFFLDNELFQTRERNAVLILLCELEHSVYVMSDKGFQGKVPETYWSEIGVKLARDFDRNRPGNSFFQALDELLEISAKVFPRRPDDQNELSNRLRIDRRNGP
jgi:uncharacterized membrane protein